MGTMEHLKSLVLDGNPLRSLRRDVVMVRFVYVWCYLTIICRRQSEYCGTIPRQSQGDYSTMFAEPDENVIITVFTRV